MSKDDFVKMTKPTLRNKVKECINTVEKWKDNPCYKNIVIYKIITINDLYEVLHENVPVEYNYETWNITNDIVDDFRTNPTKYYRQVSLQKSQQSKKQEYSQPTPIKNNPEQKYTLSLAWSETNSNNVSNTINIVKEYFNDIGIEEIDYETYDNGKKIEHIIKYEFEGDSKSFKILKYSAQFLLDTISTSDYEKFNIAIYGKKKEL